MGSVWVAYPDNTSTMLNILNAMRALGNNNYASSNYRPGPARNLTGQQRQDDMRAAAMGYRNVRGGDGRLIGQQNPVAVNLDRAMKLSAGPRIMNATNPRDRDLYDAGQMIRGTIAHQNEQNREKEMMRRAQVGDTLGQYAQNARERHRSTQNWKWEDKQRGRDWKWEDEQRGRERTNWGWEDQERNRERRDWGWADEQRDWQREMWGRTRSALSGVNSGGGGSSIGVNTGSYGVSGLS